MVSEISNPKSFFFLIGQFILFIYSLAGIRGTAFAYLGEFHTNENRPRNIAYLASFLSFGMLLLPLVGSLILTQSFEYNLPGFGVIKPWRLFILLSCCLSLLCYLFLLKMPESPRFLQARGRKVEALHVMQKMFSINTGQSKKVFKLLNNILKLVWFRVEKNKKLILRNLMLMISSN